MAAGTYNISIEKRATFSMTLTIKNANGSAYDLSGTVLVSQIRVNSSNTLQDSFTIELIGDPTEGVVQVSLSKDQTSRLSLGQSSYDIFADKIDGTSEKLLQGSVTIIENETQLSAGPVPISNTYTPRRNLDFFNYNLISDDLSQYNYVDTGCFSGIDVMGLNAVYCNQDCRVRLYNSIDYSDLTRTIYEDPANGVGLIAEIALTAGEAVQFSPALIGSVNKITNSGQSIMVSISTSSQQTEGSISGYFDILQFL